MKIGRRAAAGRYVSTLLAGCWISADQVSRVQNRNHRAVGADDYVVVCISLRLPIGLVDVQLVGQVAQRGILRERLGVAAPIEEDLRLAIAKGIDVDA